MIRGVNLSNDFDTSSPPPKVIDIQWGIMAYPYIRTDEMNKEVARYGASTALLHDRIKYLQVQVIEKDIQIRYLETSWIKRKINALKEWFKNKCPK